MKTEEIKSLFEQFEKAAAEVETLNVGVQENCIRYWVIPNGATS